MRILEMSLREDLSKIQEEVKILEERVMKKQNKDLMSVINENKIPEKLMGCILAVKNVQAVKNK